MPGILQFKTNEPQFQDFVRKYADAALITFESAFEARGRSLCDRLMKFTPPLSGKSIKSSLWNRDIEGMAANKQFLIASNAGDMKKAFEQFSPFSDPDIEDMSARQVGERRVERDIRKVIRGVDGGVIPLAVHSKNVVVISQTDPRAGNHDVQVEWAVRQKCEGRDAFRIYADKSGNVYGVDAQHFKPSPSMSELKSVHQAHRGKRGRVTTAGNKDVIVGRWRWLNIVVAPSAVVDAYIKMKKAMVGQGKGGWASAFKAFGGKISERGWVGRHMNAGQIRGWPAASRGIINVAIINNSAWASNGDPGRVMENAVEANIRDTEKLVAKILENRWGHGAATFDKTTGRTKI